MREERRKKKEGRPDVILWTLGQRSLGSPRGTEGLAGNWRWDSGLPCTTLFDFSPLWRDSPSLPMIPHICL